MSAVKDVNIKITGQVPDDYGDRDYNVLVTKLRAICAEHGVELEEVYNAPRYC